MALTRPSTYNRKVGTMNVAGTKKWDGKKWVPVNVARDGQRATRNGKPVVRKGGKWVPYKPPERGYNPVSKDTKKKPDKPNVVHRGQRATHGGKPVIADGKGNWLIIPKGTAGNGLYTGKKVGTYKPGENRTSTKTKTDPKWVRTTTVMGVEYRNDTGRAFGPKGEDGIARTSNRGYSIDPQTGKRTNGHSAPKDEKPKVEEPKVKKPKEEPVVRPPSRNTPTRSAPTPARTSKTSTYKAHGSGLHIGRHKTLAEHRAAVAKGKKTSATSATTPPRKRTWLATNYKPNGKTAAAKATQPTKQQPVKPVKPANSTKQKPLAVDKDNIPKNLNSPAGRKYMADLDAGRLTRKRK